jgi:glycosyltransferase involved in cell wall biosynthesis
MISVVIPTFNSAATLPRCFGCLMSAAIDGLVREVIVVDGGSTDPTARIADEMGAEFLHVLGESKMRRSAGAVKARHNFLLFLDGNATLGAGWEEEAEGFLASPYAQDRIALFPHSSRWRDWMRPLDERTVLMAKNIFEGAVSRTVYMKTQALTLS